MLLLFLFFAGAHSLLCDLLDGDGNSLIHCNRWTFTGSARCITESALMAPECGGNSCIEFLIPGDTACTTFEVDIPGDYVYSPTETTGVNFSFTATKLFALSGSLEMYVDMAPEDLVSGNALPVYSSHVPGVGDAFSLVQHVGLHQLCITETGADIIFLTSMTTTSDLLSCPHRRTRSKSHSRSHRSRPHHSKSRSKSHHSHSHRSHLHHSHSHRSKSRSHSHRSKSHSTSRKSKSHSHSRHSHSHSKSRHSDSHSTSHRTDSRSKSHSHRSDSHSKSRHSDSHSKSHRSDSHSKSRHSDSHSTSHKSESRSTSHHSKTHHSESRSASHESKSHSASHHSASHMSHSRSKSHMSNSHHSDSHSKSRRSRSSSHKSHSESESRQSHSGSRSHASHSHHSHSRSRSNKSNSRSHSRESDSHSRSRRSHSRSRHSHSHESQSGSASHASYSGSVSTSKRPPTRSPRRLSNSLQSLSSSLQSSSESASMENETLCDGLSAYNRGSALDTTTVDGCPFVYFRLQPSPATFQPFLGVSIRIPPIIDKLTFSYYGSGVDTFRFTYSNVCDNAVNAALNHTDVVTPPACFAANATSAKQVIQRLLTPAAAGLPDATFLNIVFLNTPPSTVVYMGEFYYRVLDGPIIVLGPCPTHDVFPLSECSCAHECIFT